jgi:hypothetical protein
LVGNYVSVVVVVVVVDIQNWLIDWCWRWGQDGSRTEMSKGICFFSFLILFCQLACYCMYVCYLLCLNLNWQGRSNLCVTWFNMYNWTVFVWNRLGFGLARASNSREEPSPGVSLALVSE